MAYTHEKYTFLKALAVVNYEKIGQIYCPYFHDFVYFNSEGIGHIIFKGKHSGRPGTDQYMRLKFLYLAPAIVSLSHTLQDYGVKISGGKIVKYYIFTAILNTISVKVVIRQVGNGTKNFYSIVPFWRKSQFYGSK